MSSQESGSKSRMNSGRPSLTAAFVSFARGVASLGPITREGLHDDAAARLIPLPFAPLLRAAQRAPSLAQPLWRAATLGFIDHMALRTEAIDEAVTDAVRDGATQLVILGAGLDARAYRLEALRDVTVFEVDHPSTQARKREKLAGLRETARRVVHVPVDFARDSLDDALAAAGHDPRSRTAWILEGVTMYLPRAATRSTLAVVAARSAVGSVLAMTYVTPDVIDPRLRGRRAVELAFRAIGEPFVGTFTPREAHDELAALGLEVLRDEGDVELARRFGGSRFAGRVFRSERVLAARKR